MTSKTITPEEIVVIHDTIQKEYNLPPGHVKTGVLETLVAQCEGVPFSDKQISPLRQAAILFEGIIRHHVFVDGNKRAALETTRLFLNRNGYMLVVPLSGTNFIYKIAQECTTDTDRVLDRITSWLDNHSAKTSQWYIVRGLLAIHVFWPMRIARFLFKIKLQRCGMWFLKRWVIKDPDVTEFVLEIYEKQFNFFDPVVEQRTE